MTTDTSKLTVYRCKSMPLKGHRYVYIVPQARRIFRVLEKKTKRRTYVRSVYFNKEKIFFDYFWAHMKQKLPSDQARRLKYLPCALELLQNTRHNPLTFEEIGAPRYLLHRFAGETPTSMQFFVQVKQDKRSGKKQCMSVFPGKENV